MSIQSIVHAATLTLWVLYVGLCAGCGDGQSVDGTEFGDSNGFTGMSNNGTSDGTTMTGTSNDTTSNGTSVTGYRYVLIEDLSATVAGEEHPGADIDAISVVTDGVERFAVTVEDHNVYHAGVSTDTTQLLGAEDSGCEATGFVSLGGAADAGWIKVGFSDSMTDVTFNSGDIINVYELGPSLCSNQPTWTDDPYSVGVSLSNADRFVEIEAVGTNQFMAP